MGIAKYIIANVEKHNGKFLRFTSVWNVHNSGLGKNPASNVYIAAENCFLDPKITKIIAVVGARGWTQHSPSEVLLFDATAMNERDIESAGVEEWRNFVSHLYPPG